MKRYIISRKPVTNELTGKIVGFIVRLSDGTTYFEQRKRDGKGWCVNYGRQWTQH